jgi:hypothetical protein
VAGSVIREEDFFWILSKEHALEIPKIYPPVALPTLKIARQGGFNWGKNEGQNEISV